MKASKLKNYLVAKKVYFKGKRYVDYLKYRVVFFASSSENVHSQLNFK